LVVCLLFPIRKVFGLEVWAFSEVVSFMRFIPAPVSTRNLALFPSLRCSTIDNNLPVVVQLTLEMFLLGSPLSGLLEVESFPSLANGEF
jgi:hypothetical protein